MRRQSGLDVPVARYEKPRRCARAGGGNYDAATGRQKVLITADRVGSSQPNEVGELPNRLIATKAGIFGAWYSWFLRFGGTGDMPSFGNVTEVYPRLRMARLIPGWDDLAGLSTSARSWNQIVTNPTYQSPNSFIDGNVMASRNPKTGKLFIVFNNASGSVRLRAGETVASARRLDPHFGADADGLGDLIVSNTNPVEVRLRSTVPIPNGVDAEGNPSGPNGVGFVLTLAGP